MIHRLGSSNTNDAVAGGGDAPQRRPRMNRKAFLATIPPLLSATASWVRPGQARAALFDSSDRRQLEFCLVAVMRVTYFAETMLAELQLASSDASSDDRKKKLYLETRLGAKAALTGKLGGGSTGRVYKLSSLQLSACLNDLEYYNKISAGAGQEFREALASLVEFDGLDTLTDDSPRSSLTLQQYDNQKAAFVERSLRERVVPLGRRLVKSFDAGAVDRAQKYVQSYYSDEIPSPPSQQGNGSS